MIGIGSRIKVEVRRRKAVVRFVSHFLTDDQIPIVTFDVVPDAGRPVVGDAAVAGRVVVFHVQLKTALLEADPVAVWLIRSPVEVLDHSQFGQPNVNVVDVLVAVIGLLRLPNQFAAEPVVVAALQPSEQKLG